MAVFINGAQGGMVTADNRVLEDLKDPLRGIWRDSGRGRSAFESVTPWPTRRYGSLPGHRCRTIPSFPAIRRRFVCRSTSDLLWTVIQHSPLKYPCHSDRTVSTRISLLNVGTAQILTIPGEALPNIGFYLKRKMRGQHNLLFGLTHDGLGYIMTKVDFQSFPRYDYISRTSLGEMTGEILMEESLKLIDRSAATASRREIASVLSAHEVRWFSLPRHPCCRTDGGVVREISGRVNPATERCATVNGKQRMAAAMRHEQVDRVPVMCQLALGHYLLNTDLTPVETWFTSEGFAEALVTLQQRYEFDGILINLLGTDPQWQRHVRRIDTAA